MKLRCIAIDDELLALELLEDNIRKIPHLHLVAACSNPLQAVQLLQEQEIDLIFSDIRMPSLNGLELIQTLPHKPMVIFITAYENFAVQSYETDVVDYLVKPVSFDRFLLASNKALTLYNLKQAAAKKETSNDKNEFIYINVEYGYIKMIYDEVMMMEALKDYIKIYWNNGKKPVLTRMSLKMAENLLPQGRFHRVHKSYIVAEKSITAIRKNSIFLGTTEIPVGDTFREKINDILGRSVRM